MLETAALGVPPPLKTLEANGPIALFLDFDGTLVEIASTPEGIELAEALAERLEALAERLEGRLALVSGRSTSDIATHLGELGVARAGSHGAERLRADGSPIGERPLDLPAEARQAAADFAAAHDGLDLEEKSHGVALHFRAVPHLEAAAIAFAEDQATHHGLWVKLGKCVVELVNHGADKAGAVHAFMLESTFSGALPVFVGDDITDEDGMRAAIELGGFGVIVGEREGTVAKYRLPSPAGVHEWLEL